MSVSAKTLVLAVAMGTIVFCSLGVNSAPLEPLAPLAPLAAMDYRNNNAVNDNRPAKDTAAKDNHPLLAANDNRPLLGANDNRPLNNNGIAKDNAPNGLLAKDGPCSSNILSGIGFSTSGDKGHCNENSGI